MLQRRKIERFQLVVVAEQVLQPFAFGNIQARQLVVVAIEPGHLFQVADVICTLELVKAKLLANGSVSESEDRFFGGIKNFKKNYLKPLTRKEYK